MSLHTLTSGEGPTVLLIHGAAEDADLLTPQAEAIAARGFRVIWYDRRGTGRSTRDGWPGDGADQHADDAAALLGRHGAHGATVLGFSSGGVVALALAARHRGAARAVVAWEPAAVTVLPDGAALHASLLAPIERHLADRPGDWTGGYEVMLDVLSGGRADLTDPRVAHMARNAEAALRDDARLITTRAFAPGEVPAQVATLAVSARPDPLHLAIAERLAELCGLSLVRVPGADDHEVYLSRPEVLADWLAERAAAPGGAVRRADPGVARVGRPPVG